MVAPLPPLAPLPAPAAGSAAAGVAVVVGLTFGLNGAPTGEPAPPLVDAPSLHDQTSSVTTGIAASVQAECIAETAPEGAGSSAVYAFGNHVHVLRCRTCIVDHGRHAAPSRPPAVQLATSLRRRAAFQAMWIDLLKCAASLPASPSMSRSISKESELDFYRQSPTQSNSLTIT